MASTTGPQITTLHYDIIFGILLHCSSLTDLRCLILTHSVFKSAFDSRQRAILRSVFETQLALDPRATRTVIQLATETINITPLGLGNHIQDLGLLEGFWLLLRRLNAKTEAARWAIILLKAYKTIPGYERLALNFATEAWPFIDCDPPMSSSVQFGLDVARTLNRAGRMEEALGLLQDLLERSYGRCSEYKLCIKLITTMYRSSERPNDAIIFLEDLWARFGDRTGAGYNKGMVSAEAVLSEYIAQNREEDSIPFLLRARERLRRSSGNYVGASRRLIRLYEKQGKEEEVLTITEQVWNNFDSRRPGYRAWTGELYKLKKAMGKEDEAVAVWESAWDILYAHYLSEPTNINFKYHLKGACASLSAAYAKASREDVGRLKAVPEDL